MFQNEKEEKDIRWNLNGYKNVENKSEGFPGSSDSKESPCMQETGVQSLGWEDSPGEGNGYPLQYACPENPMDRGA